MATLVDDPESITSVPPVVDQCPNCGTELGGEYCQECGQKRIHANDFSLRVFFGRLINDFTDLDSSKIVRTFIAMIAKPGLLAKEFLSGRRGNFVSPVKLYLIYYSFDFFSKSVFALVFITGAAFGRRLSPQVLNLFYPIGFVYLLFAIRRVYQQKWTTTVMKTFVLYLCETLLFIAVNIVGFIIAFSLV